MSPIPATARPCPPDDAESARTAAQAVRRLGDSLADSSMPADIARPLALLEPLLAEVEETLRLAAESTADGGTRAARQTAEQLGQAGATAVLLRLHLEQISTRLASYGLAFPAEPATLSPRAAAAHGRLAQSAARPVHPGAPTPAPANTAAPAARATAR
ncbi:hypothetical protein ABT263_21195 [Kitasatospora sp. NPDC001603]|uniref:hypothetical protein n=1 Tax=Kitasatospora sp. NPDC001603 TaxID=3154388 RepID=UPI003318C549